MSYDVASIATLAHSLQQQSPEESDNANGGLKRKADDGGSTQQRARRNRYVSIAWYGAASSLLGNKMRLMGSNFLATNASDERSNATDRRPVSGAAT